MVTIDDQEVTIQHGVAAKSVRADEWPGTHKPPLVTGEIIGCDHHLAGINQPFISNIWSNYLIVARLKEADVNEFTVGRRRTGRIAVQRMLRFKS